MSGYQFIACVAFFTAWVCGKDAARPTRRGWPSGARRATLIVLAVWLFAAGVAVARQESIDRAAGWTVQPRR